MEEEGEEGGLFIADIWREAHANRFLMVSRRLSLRPLFSRFNSRNERWKKNISPLLLFFFTVVCGCKIEILWEACKLRSCFRGMLLFSSSAWAFFRTCPSIPPPLLLLLPSPIPTPPSTTRGEICITLFLPSAKSMRSQKVTKRGRKRLKEDSFCNRGFFFFLEMRRFDIFLPPLSFLLLLPPPPQFP